VVLPGWCGAASCLTWQVVVPLPAAPPADLTHQIAAGAAAAADKACLPLINRQPSGTLMREQTVGNQLCQSLLLQVRDGLRCCPRRCCQSLTESCTTICTLQVPSAPLLINHARCSKGCPAHPSCHGQVLLQPAVFSHQPRLLFVMNPDSTNPNSSHLHRVFSSLRVIKLITQYTCRQVAAACLIPGVMTHDPCHVID
jgi:hypothetical protein